MAPGYSEADAKFRQDFEAGRVGPADFDHRAHLTLAYIYLCDFDTDTAYESMKAAIHGLLQRNDVDPDKYHDTLTRAWIMAVRHFMEKSDHTASADALIDQFPEMLDSNIMLTHYSAELLFSDDARARFVEPDRDKIPRYQR
jgi:hypothetical protein